jgi:hypothetical protein
MKRTDSVLMAKRLKWGDIFAALLHESVADS